MRQRLRWLVWLAVAAAAACGSEVPSAADAGAWDAPPVPGPDAQPPPDPTEPLFDPETILEVDVEIAAADWDELRMQTRTILDVLRGDCLAQPFPKPFTYFPGRVTVNGETREMVGVRKKGFIGSLDPDKPSLKVKIDEYVPGQELSGEDMFTLNNARQDPSFLHQCLAYRILADAGVRSPRCNFAHVTVNGQDLGVYVHVEGIDKDFLRRHYADDSGNLYEGTLSDFRPGWTGTFEKKTNELAGDFSDIEAMTAALQVGDGQLLDALAPHLDVDRFTTFWATEVLLAHWDGYAGNTNNFSLYHDPTTGRFEFLPWGTDGVFQLREAPPQGEPPPVSVFATGLLARRLYLLPATRDAYVARLEELLDGVWDETAILDEIDRMELLITPVAAPFEVGGIAPAADALRAFVSGRRAELEAELAAGPPPWTAPLRDPPCLTANGMVTGTFDTTWGTIAGDPFTSGTGALSATVDGLTLAIQATGSRAGWEPMAPGPPQAQIQVVSQLFDGTFAVAVMNIKPALFASGTTLPVDWVVTFGALYRFVPATGQGYFLGVFSDGTVTLDAATIAPGAAVQGSFSSELSEWPFG